MNEQIKRLAVEAFFDEETDVSTDRMYHFGEEKMQKFAELVVQECIDVVQKRYMGDLNREDLEVRRCVEDLKKHFGAE